MEVVLSSSSGVSLNPAGEAFPFHAIELYLKSFLRLHGVSAARLRHIGHDFQRLPSRAEAHRLVLTLRSGQLSGSNKGRGNWKLLRQAGATARS